MTDTNYLHSRSLSYKNRSLHIEGLEISQIAIEHETPLYVYSYKTLTSMIQFMQDVFKKKHYSIHYAAKANPHRAILSSMNYYGIGTDIVSSGELYRCLQCSIPPSSIVFSGIGKTEEDIKYALRTQIKQINIESIAEYHSIKNIAQQLSVHARVAIRINPNIAAGFHSKVSTGKKGDKFGVSLKEACLLYHMIQKDQNMIFRGFSYHIGSNITDMSCFIQALRNISHFLIKEGIYFVPCIDIGGGIPVYDHFSDGSFKLELYEQEINNILIKSSLTQEIIIEPGRFLVAKSGILITKVIFVKEKEEGTMLIVDAGMNNFIRPALYGAYHTIIPCSYEQNSCIYYSIHGPICESSDILHEKTKLRKNIKKNDHLCILDVGAYGATMASCYNSRPLCSEYMVHGDQLRKITSSIKTSFFFQNEKSIFD